MAGLRAEVFTYVAHALAVAAAVLVLVWCIHFRGGLAFESTNKSLIFNVHPVLMLIGFIIIGSEAIMSYRALPLSKEVKKRIHLILQAIAIVLGAVGIYAAFKYHNESGIANLYSLHSWIGLGTICLYGIQWILGFITFFYPGAALDFKQVALPWHALFGLFVYALAVGAAELGFLEKLTFLEESDVAKFGSEAFLVNFTALVVIFLGAFVVISTVSPNHEEDPHDYTTVADD
ncbi:probable ascorbate-specific transmembrane electron transporter 1 [Elaeis guineensis]|uniref:Probable ascorbate-specific transmembrane electron transporter 1 n=1 Tax=Elaeis guineensis var. tenera TaxID=51953 RepID=A0A6I9SBG4_ELAGV|nr:probable ascorbate-specific transmembrane electron transporter 1 [Elaeis guineensis]